LSAPSSRTRESSSDRVVASGAPRPAVPPRDDAAPRPRFHQRLVFLFVRGLVRLLELLPARIAATIVDGCGLLMHLVLRSRVHLARRQMGEALGLDPESAQVKAAVRDCFDHFLRVPLQLVRLPEMLEGRGAADVLKLEGLEHVEAAHAKGRGIVFVTAHLGNWEVLGGIAPKLGVPIASVARPVANPLLEAEMKRLRERYGQQILAKDGAGLPMARLLKRGGHVALLIDQHAGSRGWRVPFFHQDASTFTLAAELARRFDAAFIPVFTRIAGPDEVRGRLETPIECDRSLPEDEDAWRMTLLFHRRLEAAIRETPGQYLWLHRRWKSGGQEPDPAWRRRHAQAEGASPRPAGPS
jgi:KDO2-lipid IV(A) lauroyltransferase